MTMNKPALSALFIATMTFGATGAWAQCFGEPGKPCLPLSEVGRDTRAIDEGRLPSGALTAIGAWAQANVTLSGDVTITSSPSEIVTTGEGVAIVNKGSVPIRVDLSPDQKLARAFALCAGRIGVSLPAGPCEKILVAWEKENSTDIAADRAFIEEVARGLK